MNEYKFKNLSGHEKLMLYVTGVLILALMAKSLVFDGRFLSLTEEQVLFKSEVEAYIHSENGFWTSTGLVVERVVAVKRLTEEEKEAFQKEGVLSRSDFKAKTRTYFLWIIPFSEQYRILKDQERTES